MEEGGGLLKYSFLYLPHFLKTLLYFCSWLKEEMKVWKARQVISIINKENWLNYVGKMLTLLAKGSIVRQIRAKMRYQNV